MRARRAIGVLLATCLVGAACLAVPAIGAAPSKSSISVGFEQGRPFFKGTVKSPRKDCKANRRVVLFRVRSQDRRTKLKATRSDATGFWRIDMGDRMRTGAYLVSVRTRGTCARGKSEPIAVGQKGPGGIG